MTYGITIEKQPNTLWYKGTIGKYSFEAKVYDDPSTFGINEGRISKLTVWDDAKYQKTHKLFAACIMNYDRDWDVKPKAAHSAMIDALIAKLERLPH